MISESVEKVVSKAGSNEKLAEKLTKKLGLKKPLTAMAISQWKARGSVPSKYIQSLVEIGDGCVSLNDFLGCAA